MRFWRRHKVLKINCHISWVSRSCGTLDEVVTENMTPHCTEIKHSTKLQHCTTLQYILSLYWNELHSTVRYSASKKSITSPWQKVTIPWNREQGRRLKLNSTLQCSLLQWRTAPHCTPAQCSACDSLADGIKWVVQSGTRSGRSYRQFQIQCLQCPPSIMIGKWEETWLKTKQYKLKGQTYCGGAWKWKTGETKETRRSRLWNRGYCRQKEICLFVHPKEDCRDLQGVHLSAQESV